MINKTFEAKLKEEEQNTGWLLIVTFFFLSSCQFWWKVKSLFFIVNIKEATSKIIDNTVRTDIKSNIEQEIKEKVLKSSTSNTLPVLSHEINKKNTNVKRKVQNAKGSRKKKEDLVDTMINGRVMLEEQTVQEEDCIDVETIPLDEIPGI